MKYMGSKARIVKYILPIILKERKECQWYVEPFVGGANMIDKVSGNRIGADSNPHLIEALKLIRDNLQIIPKNNSEFTEDDYKNIKTMLIIHSTDMLGLHYLIVVSGLVVGVGMV